MLRRATLGALCWLAIANAAAAQQAEPLHIRNLNPLVAIFGLPAWDTIGAGTRLDATLELANHYRLSSAGGETLILDGETLRTTLSFSHTFSPTWSVGVDLPYYRIGGGVLDDVIDGWHSAFGMPDGGRNNRPEGQFLFVLADRVGQFLAIDRPQSGAGDVQVKVAHSVGNGRFVVQGTLKLATGDADQLMGSGSADFILTLLRSQALPARSRPIGYYWGVGVMRVGGPDRVEFDARRWAFTGIVGGTWQLWRRAGLKAQLDVHSAFYDSPLEEIGKTGIEATFGAWLERGKRTELEFAIVEDLAVSTAPDVVLQAAAHWRW